MKSKLSKFAIPIALLVLGILLLAYSVVEGKGQIYWILFIPVFSATSIFAFIGTILIIVALVLIFIVFIREFTIPYEPEPGQQKAAKTRQPAPSQAPGAKKKFGGVVLIGPIPVIFGSDPKTTIIIIVLAIILIIAAILFIVFFWNP